MQYAETELKTDKSSWILSINYDDDAEILTINLKDGHTYEYADVSAEVYECFYDAPSKGEFYNEHIIGNYLSTKIQ